MDRYYHNRDNILGIYKNDITKENCPYCGNGLYETLFCKYKNYKYGFMRMYTGCEDHFFDSHVDFFVSDLVDDIEVKLTPEEKREYCLVLDSVKNKHVTISNIIIEDYDKDIIKILPYPNLLRKILKSKYSEKTNNILCIIGEYMGCVLPKCTFQFTYDSAISLVKDLLLDCLYTVVNEYNELKNKYYVATDKFHIYCYVNNTYFCFCKIEPHCVLINSDINHNSGVCYPYYYKHYYYNCGYKEYNSDIFYCSKRYVNIYAVFDAYIILFGDIHGLKNKKITKYKFDNEEKYYQSSDTMLKYYSTPFLKEYYDGDNRVVYKQKYYYNTFFNHFCEVTDDNIYCTVHDHIKFKELIEIVYIVENKL